MNEWTLRYTRAMADATRVKRELQTLFATVPTLHRIVPDAVDLFEAASTVARPLASESAAVSLHAPKTAALLYDRVWTPQIIGLPESIGLCAGTDAELSLRVRAFFAEQMSIGENAPDNAEWWRSQGRVLYSREVAEVLAGVSVVAVPLYDTADRCAREYRSGAYEVVLAVLPQVPLPVESMLVWDQVVEMRRDDESRMRVRRFKHWLDTDMVGKPATYISNEIAIRIVDYEKALKKHGVATAIGSLQAALDAKVLTGGAAAIASLSFANSPTAALIAGGAVVLGNVALYLARALFDIENVRESTQPEIAFIAEVADRAAKRTAG